MTISFAIIASPTLALAQPAATEEGALDNDSGTVESELEFDPEASLLEGILEEYGLSHFADCAASGSVMINEICAVGTECNPDVRISDYVELYNPGARAVDLHCFALSARDFKAFVPSGRLDPGAVRAFSERALGFRIAKDQDVIVLYALGLDSTGGPTLSESERVHLDEESAHAYRLPDGGQWRSFTAQEAETDWPGTFDAPNAPPPEPTSDR